MNHYLRLLLRCAFSLAGWCVMAFAFMSIGVYASHSYEQVKKYEKVAEIEAAKYEAQRTADLVALVTNSKKPIQDFGCPTGEVRIPKKKGSKKVC